MELTVQSVFNSNSNFCYMKQDGSFAGGRFDGAVAAGGRSVRVRREMFKERGSGVMERAKRGNITREVRNEQEVGKGSVKVEVWAGRGAVTGRAEERRRAVTVGEGIRGVVEDKEAINSGTGVGELIGSKQKKSQIRVGVFRDGSEWANSGILFSDFPNLRGKRWGR